MDRKLGGLALLVLCGVAQAQDCDWRITSDKIDPMTDQRTCMIMSASAKIGIGVKGDDVIFLTGSAYRHGRDGLTVRIDNAPAIYLGENRSTAGFKDPARRALQEIRTGSRLRTDYRDYPTSKQGDAPICILPQLIDTCLMPSR